MTYRFINLSYQGAIATLTLARPDLHNAFNADMIGELRDCLLSLASDPAARVVVLTGAGRSFCAGADLNWMRASLDWSREQNSADANALADMFEAAWGLPKPLIGRVNGAAMGGGAGLVACCDSAIAVDSARFAFSEVKLGLLPAVIAQYVVPKIGLSQARALFVSGERFDAQRALAIGLIHAVASADQLDAAVDTLANQLLGNGPAAVAAAKRTIDAVWSLERDKARHYVVQAIADARASPEGQEGLRAFLEKRKPAWDV